MHLSLLQGEKIMNNSAKHLIAHLTSWSPDCDNPDIETVLDFLWYFYTDEHPIYSETIKQSFQNLESVFDSLTLEHADLLFAEVCSLCQEHEKLAFLEGLHLGAKLVQELM